MLWPRLASKVLARLAGGAVTIAAACFGQTFMYAYAHGDVVNDGDRWEYQDMDGHVGERETERGIRGNDLFFSLSSWDERASWIMILWI